MRIIDAHLHLWDIKRLRYPWLETVPALQRDFLPADYQAAAAGTPVEALVVVQGECLPERYREEVLFIQEQVHTDTRIQALVAYAPVEDERLLEEALQFFSTIPLVKGVRRMYDEAPSLCIQPSFIKGLHRLAACGYSFDISVKPHALPDTISMIVQCPQTPFVLDHLGKPDIRNRAFDTYRKHIDALSALENVTAKISGLVTEAHWQNWTAETLRPYIDYAIDKFGFQRLMFGSDYPVVLLAATYDKWLTTVHDAVRGCTPEEEAALFYGTAKRVYRL
ncbi:amidohydrolase family protein [Niabella beijingensis]|uniref:amidohydrolase family protein n=1 Tax=Niabella beijingensis TaxID=2872700 RepID=UPI001CBDEE0C|nr:amidohydrolase family protein [Niabella beijingensis]MBZ4190532.1 amidohydrolase family protein [Niabella beijingensis]